MDIADGPELADVLRILTLRAPSQREEGGGGHAHRGGGDMEHDSHVVFSCAHATHVLALKGLEFVPVSLLAWDHDSMTLAVLATPLGLTLKRALKP